MKHNQTPATAGVLRPITLADRSLFEAAFARLNDPVSDSTFSACYLWADTLSFRWSVIEDHLCVFSAASAELCLILPPMALSLAAERRGRACLAECFRVMDAYNGPRAGVHRSRIEYVSDEVLDRLRAAGVTLSAEPMYADYVYPARAMIDLAGGDLKGKRKLCHAFCRDHPDARTTELTPADLDACEELLGRWKQRADDSHEGETNEQSIESAVLRAHDDQCTRTALREFVALGLESLALWSGDRLIGFTLGERLGPRTASVLIEKVEPGVRGAAQYIFSEFCRQRFADCDFINAGDDWGLPALRYTKTSYRPTRLVSKSVLTRPDAELPVTTAATAAIRPARRGDTASLLAIEAAAFDHPDDRFTPRQIRGLLANPRADVLVAERDGSVVGWAAALTRRVRDGAAGRLYAIAVLPESAGRGIGRALALEILAALDARAVGVVTLEVRADNAPALTLYRSLGFEDAAPLPGYYAAGRDGLRMRRPHAHTRFPARRA